MNFIIPMYSDIIPTAERTACYGNYEIHSYCQMYFFQAVIQRDQLAKKIRRNKSCQHSTFKIKIQSYFTEAKYQTLLRDLVLFQFTKQHHTSLKIQNMRKIYLD